MFEKVFDIAERAATNVSRRQFLGGFGRGAMTAAAGLGGLLVLAGNARAGKKIRICPAGSEPTCVGRQENSSCTGDTEVGHCSFETTGPRNSRVCICCDCKHDNGKHKPPPCKAC